MNLIELSATVAVEAMRNGDIKAEDYARALLDKARDLDSLNAFRILNCEMVLQAARAADKSRASGAALSANCPIGNRGGHVGVNPSSSDDVWSDGIASEFGPVPERRHHAAYGQ
jgi:hypothetical protein